MSAILQEITNKIKSLLADQALFTAALLILASLTSFGLGRQSVEVDLPPNTTGLAEVASAGQPATTSTTKTSDTASSGTYYVASKNGKVYHLPFCSGAKRISPANLVKYESKEAAEAAGLRPAANCPGI